MLRIPVLLLCCLAGQATAATVYKCVENGRPSYSDRPCGRTAVELPPPSSGADPETLARLARQSALVQDIEGARALREQKEARDAARIERAAAVQRRRCDKLRLEAKWAGEDAARAAKDDAGAARIKAKRQAEALAAECPP